MSEKVLCESCGRPSIVPVMCDRMHGSPIIMDSTINVDFIKAIWDEQSIIRKTSVLVDENGKIICFTYNGDKYIKEKGDKDE
jgi:hypothetical protein